MTYRPLPDYLEIKDSDINGQGLFTKEDVNKDRDFGVSHMVRLNDSTNVYRTPLGGFYNHSEDPNCYKVFVRYTDADKDSFFHGEYHLVAKRNIKKGEELTVHYTMYDPKE